MSLSKYDITVLIRKRRKQTLYRMISLLQTVVESNVFDIEEYSRSRFAVNHPYSVVYPYPGYRRLDAKHVPPVAYRAWYMYFIEQPENKFFVWPKFLNVHPKDHEWLLNELLQ